MDPFIVLVFLAIRIAFSYFRGGRRRKLRIARKNHWPRKTVPTYSNTENQRFSRQTIRRAQFRISLHPRRVVSAPVPTQPYSRAAPQRRASFSEVRRKGSLFGARNPDFQFGSSESTHTTSGYSNSRSPSSFPIGSWGSGRGPKGKAITGRGSVQ